MNRRNVQRWESNENRESLECIKKEYKHLQQVSVFIRFKI